MASHVTTTTRSSSTQEAHFPVAGDDIPQHDSMYYGDGSDVEEAEDVDDDHMGTHTSRLSVESSEGDADADVDSSDDKRIDKKKAAAFEDDDDDILTIDYDRGINYLSLPGTPARYRPRRRSGSTRQYASETEARGDRARRKSAGRGGACSDRSTSYYSIRATEDMSWGDRVWEMRRWRCATSDGGGADSHSGGSSPCVVVRPRGRGAASMCMDMDEVRACRDLGLELPSDWTVELPPVAFHGAAAADTSSGGDSPICEDPRDMKARLRVWAQAVALASASRLSG